MESVVHLDVEVVLRIHIDQIERYGGSHGVRDAGLLASALAVPRAGYAGELLHTTVHEQASAYLYHLVRNHPFVDGNKRTGTAAALIFLYLNGFEVLASNEAVVELTLGVAEGQTPKSDIAVFLRKHSRLLDA